jgi:hypothetical protein
MTVKWTRTWSTQLQHYESLRVWVSLLLKSFSVQIEIKHQVK